MAAQRVCADRRLRRLEGVSLRSSWNGQRLYLALDTTVLWNRYCMIHLSVICGGRAIPFMWKVMEHKSSTVAFKEYKLMLELSHRLLSQYPDIMLLADRGFANHQLIKDSRSQSFGAFIFSAGLTPLAA